MITAHPKFIMPRLAVMLALAFLFLSADLWAIMGIEASEVTFRVIDAVHYRSPAKTSLDIEIIDSDNHIITPGRRFNVELILSPDSEIKIGQTLQADFDGVIDDLGSGRISIGFDPSTVVIVDDNPACSEIPWSFWEPVFAFLPALKVAFILFWWLVVLLLVYRRHPTEL